MFGTIGSLASRALRRRPGAAPALDPAPDIPSTVYQVGTMDALLAGAYGGTAAVAELLDQGNHGLGSLEHLDGELIVVDGLAYRLGTDGAAQPVGGEQRVAFGMVLPFAPASFRGLDWSEGCEVERLVDRLAKGSGLVQGIRLDGVFRRVRVASVGRQERPYRPYAELLAGAPESVWQDVPGTLVGFRTAASLEGMSGSGFRFHFVDDERRLGGRVTDFTVGKGTLAVHVGAGLRLAVLPQSRDGMHRAA
jgi:acetolactate decarboxylase